MKTNKEELLDVFDKALRHQPVEMGVDILDILLPEGCMRVEFNGRLYHITVMEIDERGNILEEDSDGIVQK
jgi:hypothetical protein